MESEKALAQTRNRVTGSSNRQPGHQTGNQVMKEVTASVGVKEYGERFCGDRWHIDGPSGGLHAYIDEVLSAAPPDVEGSTLQAHFAPPRWRMPPPPLSHALENMLRRNGSNPLPPPSSGRGAKLAANTTTKVRTRRGTVPPLQRVH